jgi:exonuclease SbcC
MLNWLFKKRGAVGAPQAAPAPQPTPQARADDKSKQAEVARALWLPRLQAAQGDDAALLQVAQAATVLEIKLAAVEALVTEEALKKAEREFRSHDRSVHRAAKRRLLAAVAQREARARANALIETATALAGVALLPANRLVELDRDWQALDARLLDASQRSEFAAQRDRLDAAVRERGEQQQRLQRWSAEATRALAELRLACAQAAAHGSDGDITVRSAAAWALLESHPEAPAAAALTEALKEALQTAAAVEARLAWLAAPELPAEGAATAADRWQALPPLADGEPARLLNDRFEQWQRRQAPARAAASAAPLSPLVSTAPAAAQLLGLDSLLQRAEAALAEGQLGAMLQHLQSIDAALDAMSGIRLGDTLHARHQALHAERARLKGWQQWGGGRARDDLVTEAEELARRTLTAADPAAPDVSKLPLKAHGEVIHALRTRWKELDRLGAPAGQALWQRFDAALQTAYEPVAAHQAALKAAREDNLLAREALLTTLEATPVQTEFTNADELTAYWKDQLRALERFHLAWRQLGPLEHTVPARARSALQQRLHGSVERIEAPLQAARRAAEAVREQFIARAEALVRELGMNPQLRDAIPRVRELQSEWQQHARTLPLARATESALWARFKAATDAVFAQREAAFSAREAELAAHVQAREALLARLSTLSDDAPVAELQRTLAEVDGAWRQPVELPRGAGGALEARYRDVREAALRHLSEGAQKHWQAQCDTLAARLALCEEREQSSTDNKGDLAERWAAQGTLPPAWEKALAQRWAQPAEAGPLPGPAFDELLLQLEAALDLPATPESLATRRELKLRAMKDTLEGRASSNPGPGRPAEGWSAALRQSGATEVQRERLHALVAALRRAAPGSLESPAPRG